MSSTFEVTGRNQFDISYVDGSSSKGDYFTDVFSIGGATVSNMTMGLGSQTDIPNGLVGVGYALSEAIVSDTGRTSSAYPNLPVNMVNESLINTIAYSLWLNDLDASTGSILFGGIDTEKYKGDMTRVQIYPISGTTDLFTSFKVALTSVVATSPSGSDALSSDTFMGVVLDSGTTLSYLPNDIAQQIWTEVGAVYDPTLDLALIPCSMQTGAGSISFGFAGPRRPPDQRHHGRAGAGPHHKWPSLPDPQWQKQGPICLLVPASRILPPRARSFSATHSCVPPMSSTIW